MSGLIGNARPQSILAAGDDSPLCDEFFWSLDAFVQPDPLVDVQPGELQHFLDFSSPWWPAGGCVCAMDGGDMMATSRGPIDYYPVSGCNGRLGFVGFTRTATGSPVAGVTVRCFRTSTDELVSSVVSDANGFYQATTPYSDGHYLVTHSTVQSPQIAGATVSSLTPA